MGKKSPATPPAPDPYATAQAQIGVNRDAAVTQANLNRINQVTPEGSLTYSTNGTNPDGTPIYTQTQTYSPDEQRKYEQNNQVATALNDTAISNIGRVQDAQSKDFNYSGITPGVNNIGGSNFRGIGDTGQIQSGLDYSNLTKLPGTSDFGAEGQRMADSVYSQAASRLDPRFKQQEDDQRARLAAQGIPVGSEAEQRDWGNFSRDKNDAYTSAQNASQLAGANEQSRLFNLAMGARQQGQNEADTQGQFANEAQQQRFSQEGTRVGIDNTNQTQLFNERGANAALANTGREREIQERAYLRNVPLNDIAALMSGSQVNAPTFSAVPQASVGTADYQGMVQNNYNQALQQQQAKQAARSQMIGSIFGGLGAVGGAAIGKYG